jgi:nitrogen fixation protein NifU and related proteins
MSDLRELYNDMILEHGKKPRNFRVQGEGSRHVEGYNPLCGDRFTVFLKLDGDRAEDVSFQGKGCAVSTASASIMTQLIKGRTRAEAETLFTLFHDLLTGKLDADVEKERLDKLIAFKDVPKYPIRVKCATLPWHTLRAALQSEEKSVSTE